MDDPIQAAIYDGIKRSIKLCLDNDCFAAALTLIYSGIDTMAALGMPETQEDVKPRDYVAWCEGFLKIPGNVPVTGIEWYAARCAVLHTHGVQSKLSRQGKARKIGYMDKAIPEVVCRPEIDPTFIMVSIDALAQAFFDGIDKSLIYMFADSARRAIAEKRLPGLLVAGPFNDAEKPESS
jgi:hypothetical protein